MRAIAENSVPLCVYLNHHPDASQPRWAQQGAKTVHEKEGGLGGPSLPGESPGAGSEMPGAKKGRAGVWRR